MPCARQLVLVRVLLLSNDIQVIDILSGAAQQIGVHLEPCCNAQLAISKLCRAKFEGVMLDLDLEGGLNLLDRVRSLTSNRSAISFAILGQRLMHTDAFLRGANFVMERPLSKDAILQVLTAAYPLMVREKRRYFRYPLRVEVAVARGSETEFTVTSL